MHAGFGLALALAFAFALTNGFHDASNAIATLVATRAARPLQAVVLASVFDLLGPLVVRAAVADTIGGIVTLGPGGGDRVIGAGLLAAVAWNVLTWWLALPSSSGHALVGGLRRRGPARGRRRRAPLGRTRRHPSGRRPGHAHRARDLAGVRGAGGAGRNPRSARDGTRATRRGDFRCGPASGRQAAALALSHGANDAQKAAGVVAALSPTGASGTWRHPRGPSSPAPRC
jgi:PiT family inorganic phosphate transporter